MLLTFYLKSNVKKDILIKNIGNCVSEFIKSITGKEIAVKINEIDDYYDSNKIRRVIVWCCELSTFIPRDKGTIDNLNYKFNNDLNDKLLKVDFMGVNHEIIIENNNKVTRKTAIVLSDALHKFCIINSFTYGGYTNDVENCALKFTLRSYPHNITCVKDFKKLDDRLKQGITSTISLPVGTKVLVRKI